MATDSQLKQGRRTLAVEIKRLQELVELDTLLGENIKEKVLDSEIKVKRQELEAIKRETQIEKDQAKADREKREANLAIDKAEFDKKVAEQAKGFEAQMKEWQARGNERETAWQNAVRNNEQRISQAQKKADEGVQEIVGNAESKKRELKQELVGLAELRDSMKEEIRAMQDKFGVRV